jgi:hypothetical protein
MAWEAGCKGMLGVAPLTYDHTKPGLSGPDRKSCCLRCGYSLGLRE